MYECWVSRQRFAKISGVTIKALRHYDKVGLLCPKINPENNYRQYSDLHLAKVQKIIALKYFGFSLSQIKNILDSDTFDQFDLHHQAELLEQHARQLEKSAKLLKKVAAAKHSDQTISWDCIHHSISAFQMLEKLRQSIYGEVLNEQELEELASIQSHLSPESATNFSLRWKCIGHKVAENLSLSPESDVAQGIADEAWQILDEFYGKDQITLRRAIWRKIYLSKQLQSPEVFTEPVVLWLNAAFNYLKLRRVAAQLESLESTNNKNFHQHAMKLIAKQVDGTRYTISQIIKKLIESDLLSEQVKSKLCHSVGS